LSLASAGEENLGVSAEVWDRDPGLLGCANGVIELQTGNFRPAKPEDFIRTISPVEWQGLDATAPRWDQFLLEIFNNNQELVDFLQRLMGYALSGQVSEHIFPIFWGLGRNGKSTLMETIKQILDRLVGPIPTETLMKQHLIASGAVPSPDIMLLKGRRIVWASETSENGKLNIEKIKRFAGGDTLIARAPYGKHMIEFSPTHTLFLLTNHKPQIQDNDYAFWNRVVMIPFTISFVDEPTQPFERKRDRQLMSKLLEEKSGILAWMVRGCLSWKQEGLNPPEIVKAATQEYEHEEDIIGQIY
jgi:putative DNA primase/helicase